MIYFEDILSLWPFLILAAIAWGIHLFADAKHREEVRWHRLKRAADLASLAHRQQQDNHHDQP